MRERERERRVDLDFVFVQDSGLVGYAWLAKPLMYGENSIQHPVRIVLQLVLGKCSKGVQAPPLYSVQWKPWRWCMTSTSMFLRSSFEDHGKSGKDLERH